MGERLRTREKELESAGKALQLSIDLQGKLGKANEGLRLAEGKLEEAEKQLREKAAEMLKLYGENKEKKDEIGHLDSKLQTESSKSANLQAELSYKISYYSLRHVAELEARLQDLQQSSTQSRAQLEQSVAQLTLEKTQLSASVAVLTQSALQSETQLKALRE